jgi:hypothetical protein
LVTTEFRSVGTLALYIGSWGHAPSVASHRMRGGGESPGGASRGGGHDRLIHVVRATGQDDARVRLGAAINRVVPRYNINIQYIYRD